MPTLFLSKRSVIIQADSRVSLVQDISKYLLALAHTVRIMPNTYLKTINFKWTHWNITTIFIVGNFFMLFTILPVHSVLFATDIDNCLVAYFKQYAILCPSIVRLSFNRCSWLLLRAPIRPRDPIDWPSYIASRPLSPGTARNGRTMRLALSCLPLALLLIANVVPSKAQSKWM